MNLEEGERVVLELEKGWNSGLSQSELVLTNKRLIRLVKGEIESEVWIEEIDEAYQDVDLFGVTSLNLRLKDGEEISITFKCGGLKALLGTTYILPKQRALTDRWVNAINNL